MRGVVNMKAITCKMACPEQLPRLRRLCKKDYAGFVCDMKIQYGNRLKQLEQEQSKEGR
jgi:hypothetical protein